MPKTKKIADRMDEIGKNTSQLFLFAFEKSGTGPPIGLMHLDQDKVEESPEGIRAFLRIFQRYLPMSLNDSMSIGEYIDENKIEQLADDDPGDYLTTITSDKEQNLDICKAAINPLVILLHVDQGSFADGTYTPFATPKANNRSIDGKHVDVLAGRVVLKENVIKQEDFSILPYMIHMVNSVTADSRTARMHYRCTLNRDPESKLTIIDKITWSVSLDEVEWIYKVSQKEMWVDVIQSKLRNMKQSSVSNECMVIILTGGIAFKKLFCTPRHPVWKTEGSC